jgi:hypothetical protein
LLYANKSFLVSTHTVENNGYIETMSGSIPVRVGDIVTTDHYGNVEVTTKEVFNERYVPVSKVKVEDKREIKLSPFEEQYTNAFYSYNGLNDQVEDPEYIEELKNFVKNKAL